MALAGCNDPEPTKVSSRAKAVSYQPPAPLKSWDEFRFGMSFDEALNVSTTDWEADSLLQCIEQMPVKGCRLSPDPKRSYRASIAGMQLLPNLNFNQEGKLTDIDLRGDYRAGVTPAQCEAMHVRLLDHLVAQYRRTSLSKDQSINLKKSARGNVYHVGSSSDIVIVYGFERFRTASDGSHVSLLTTFTAGSEYSQPRCEPSLYVNGPKSIVRAPALAVDVES